MPVYRKEQRFENDDGKDYANITQFIKDFISVEQGICSVYARDTSGSVSITGDDPDTLDNWINHTFTNVPVGMKRIIMGREITIHITNSSLDMAPGEIIFCKNFDGKTNHRIVLKEVGELSTASVDDFSAW